MSFEHTEQKYHIPARNVKAFKNFKAENYAVLPKLGIHVISDGKPGGREIGRQMYAAMDANLQPLVNTATIPGLVQFYQTWTPGFTFVVTKKRKIDSLIGITIVGEWDSQEVVNSELNLTGNAVEYGDTTNVPLASYNPNFNRYTMVRFEEGMMVGRLEESRASRINLNSAASKREAAANALEIIRNSVGFNGFNNGLGRTFGFLNAEDLPAYVTAGTKAAGGTTWAKGTYLEIVADLLTQISSIRTSSGEQVDPSEMNMTLAVATNARDYLGKVSEFGNSVMEWLNDTYPKIRVESAPELVGANSGQSVCYLYADRIDDLSTDDGKVFVQMIGSKFTTLGVEMKAKGYLEDYSNALAGVALKRPWAVFRMTGI